MAELADIIGGKIDAGTLPRERPEKLFAGWGDGRPCCACDAPILPVQVEWSIRERDIVTVRFHVGCHGLWEEQLRKRRLVAPFIRTPLELVAHQLRRYPMGLCLTCLADLSMLGPDTVTAVVDQLAHTITVMRQGVCGGCGDARKLIRL